MSGAMAFSDSGEASTKRKRKSKSKRKRKRPSCGDYPFVRRFRHRRLAGYLDAHRFSGTLTALTHEMNEFMSVDQLQLFVLNSQWADARSYFRRLVPFPYEQLGLEGRVLARFLDLHCLFAEIYSGRNPTASVFSQDAVHALTTKLRSSYTLSQMKMAFILPRMWRKAAEIVRDLAYSDPHLQQLIHKPVCVNPPDVLPIGFGFRPRRPVKKQGQVPAPVVARSFRFHLDKLDNKNRLPGTIPAPQLPRPGPSVTEMEWFWHIVEVSFQAGYPLNLFRPPKHICEQAMQTWIDTSGRRAECVAIPSRIISLADIPPPDPLLTIFERVLASTNTVAYPVPHPIFCILKSSLSSTNTGHTENNGILSVANADAPASQTNLGISSVLNRNTGIPSSTNEGAPASKTNLGMSAVLNRNTGNPSSTNADAPVSPTMKLTSCAENAAISSLIAKSVADAPVSPTMKLTSCAENAAISSVMNAGRKQSQGDFHRESVRRPVTRSF